MGYPVMTNDRDNDRRLAYAIWHNELDDVNDVHDYMKMISKPSRK